MCEQAEKFIDETAAVQFAPASECESDGGLPGAENIQYAAMGKRLQFVYGLSPGQGH